MSETLISPVASYLKSQQETFPVVTVQWISSYVLPADEEERRRLVTQHNMLKRALGYILHPQITIKPGDKILDSGTGTGIWSLEVAGQVGLPADVSFQCIDISARLFPPPSSLPPNISFSINSILTPPAEWTGTFDLIHQRLLVAALPEPEWRQALREMYRVLKPGGYVQLLEHNPRVERLSGPAQEKVMAIHKGLYQTKGLLWDLVDKLPQFLKDAGFIVEATDRACPPLGKWAADQNGEHTLRNYIDFFSALGPRCVEAGLIGSKEEYQVLLRQMEDEWNGMSPEEGDKCRFGWYIFVARKPGGEQ